MSGTPLVAAGNEDMSAAWDGDEGAHWAAYAESYERTAEPYRVRLLEAAALQPGERVLDIGCGAGRTTLQAAQAVAPDGAVVGVDLSAAMLRRGEERAAEQGLDNARFVRADAQIHAFDRDAFDVVISQFGVMFFADPVAAFRNVAGAVRGGGRLRVMVWQGLDRNEWVRTLRSTLAAGRDLPVPPPGAPGPFSFADQARVTDVLTQAGWADVSTTEVAEDFTVGANGDEAFAFVRGMGITRSLLADLDESTQERVLMEVRELLSSRQTGAGVVFESAAWLVSAIRG